MNLGKLKYGIDWEDKGWVSFGQETYNTGNVLSNARFFDTQLSSYMTGSATKKQSIVPLGLYGLEEVEIDFHEGTGFYTLGLNTVTGTHAIPVVGTQDYTWWYWLSSENDYTNDGSHSFVASINEFNVSNVLVTTHDVAVNLDGNSIPGPHYVSFTTDPTTTYISFVLAKTDLDFTPLKITLHGVLMYDFTGIVLPTWGNGESVPGTIIDNDITNYVLQAQGSIGKTSWETILFDEGKLSLTLDNQDRRFSPEYPSSPYYTYMKPYKRVWVGLSDSKGIYRLIWAGWTHQYTLKTGIKNDRQASITARQGKYNVEAQDPLDLVSLAGKYSFQLILALFSGGYVIPSQSGDETTTPDTVLESYEPGIIVPIFGTSFVGQPDPSYLNALQEVAEINGNYLFLSRQGRVIFKTYQGVRDAFPDELPYPLTMHMDYVYSPVDLYKKIVINYDEYGTSSSIEMQGQDQIIHSGASSFPFSIYPQYNGKPLIGDVVLDVSAFLPVDYGATPAFGTANAAFTLILEGIYTYYTALANNSTDLDYRLSLVSRASGVVWYATEVGKKYEVTGILDRALPTLSYNNSLITNDTMAEDFATMQINRRGSIISGFENAEIVNKSATAIDWIIDHSVGDVIFAQEEQSGNIPKHLIIIGESFTYSPTYFQMFYNLAPTGAEVDLAAFDFVVNGQEVTFTDQSVISETPPTYLWDFGD